MRPPLKIMFNPSDTGNIHLNISLEFSEAGTYDVVMLVLISYGITLALKVQSSSYNI